MHSPEHAQEIQEARKLGGARRKREVTLAGAYEVEGVGSVQDVQRILQIALLETLAMENSMSRNRTLIYLAMAALKALEAGSHEERIVALEKAIKDRRIASESPVFDVDAELIERPEEGKNESR
ncbi:MAG: hypothetical protein HYX90_08880 [Chloroflexi bacterium]|nr:hypothetical protein [Chloroflexota bacterium]